MLSFSSGSCRKPAVPESINAEKVERPTECLICIGMENAYGDENSLSVGLGLWDHESVSGIGPGRWRS